MSLLAAGLPAGLVESLPLIDVGAGALVTLVVLLILTGRLVPRSTVQDRVGDLIAERDHLRETVDELLDQNRQLMVTGQVTRDVLRALPEPREHTEAAP